MKVHPFIINCDNKQTVFQRWNVNHARTNVYDIIGIRRTTIIMTMPPSFRNHLDNKFWLLADNKKLAGGCPRSGLPLVKLGLPDRLRKVDALFKWDVNKEYYIFAGDQYWLLDVKASPPFGKVAPSPDYPRRIKDTWRGIPTPVTAAYTTLNGCYCLLILYK